MIDIKVTNLSDTLTGEYKVEVNDGGEVSRHVVGVPADYLNSLGYESFDEEVIKSMLRHSFQFLLKREPKEAILKRFKLSEIERYFPEYKHEFRKN